MKNPKPLLINRDKWQGTEKNPRPLKGRKRRKRTPRPSR